MNLENTSRIKRIAFFSGTVVLALVAGAAGAAVVGSALMNSFSVSPGFVVSTVSRPAAKTDVTKVGEAAKSSIFLYKKQAGTSALDKAYLPSEAMGGGVVLTSDGWVVTASATLAGRDTLVAVFSDKTSLVVDPAKAVRDEATGLAFIKLEAQRLAVASFGDDTTVRAADPVFSVGPQSIVAASVLAPRVLPVRTKIEYVESTDRLGRRMIMDRSGLVGAPVVDASGEVVGIDMGDGVAVPASFVTGVLREIFKSGNIIRPVFGARFISLDNLPNVLGAGFLESGALLTGGAKYRAIEKGSAAEAAGLKEGDVITFVEHDRINDKETLAERLQDYAPGAKIELTVSRAGKDIKLPLTLK